MPKKSKTKKLEIKTLINLGDVFKNLKENQKAIAFYNQALQVARESKEQELEAEALNNLGLAYGLGLGEWQQSLKYYQQSLEIARETKNREAESWALILIGGAYQYIGNVPKGIETFEQALTISREISALKSEGWALVSLGSDYLVLGDHQKAIDLSQQALAIARGEHSINGKTIKDRNLEGYALFVLGGSYSVGQSDDRKALELLEQSLTIAREVKDNFLEASALTYQSLAYTSLLEYPKAIEAGEQSLKIAKESNIPFAQMLPMLSLAGIYEGLGNYPKATSFYSSVLEIARKTQSHPMEGIALLGLSSIYHAQGNAQKTIEFAQQAAVAFEESKSPLLKSLALGSLSTGYTGLQDYPKAISAAQETLKIARNLKNRGLEYSALKQLGYIYRKSGQTQQAISFYQAALATDTTPEIPGSGAGARTGLARVYRSLNMPNTAISYYKQAVSGIEQVRQKIQGLPPYLQQSFLQAGAEGDKIVDTYRELADLLLSQGRILEAQQVLELLKVQEIKDFTRSGGKNPEVALNQTEEQIKKENGTLIAFGQKIYDCQQTKCKQLSQLLDQRQTLTEQFNQKIQTIEKEIRERRAKDDAFFDPSKLNKAKEIVEAQPGTILIYPLVLPDKIWLLWTAQGGIVKSVEVPNVGQKQLGETVLKFRQLLQNPNSDITQVKATGKQLYDWLIKPIKPELKTNKIQNLVFSLDRASRYIPMSALFDGEKYLVENYAISLVLSADLTDTKDRLPPGTQNTPVLALGLSNAVAGFNSLPNVPAELGAIVRKKPNDTTGIYPGLEFLNETFDFRALRDNLTGRKILHVATHGQFVPGRQEDSYLLLGKGEKLTIAQIKTLQDLSNINLVVLSACETALGGADQDGVEINGISFSFLNAGAKAVMASLWLVNDESTSKLMQNFYTNLAQGTATTPITKATALRQAQLSLLRGKPTKTETTEQRASLEVRPLSDSQIPTNSIAPGFSHPYYWAPFILIGNSL